MNMHSPATEGKFVVQTTVVYADDGGTHAVCLFCKASLVFASLAHKKVFTYEKCLQVKLDYWIPLKL